MTADRAPSTWLGTTALLTAVTMLAFAANSLLTRLALQTTAIDPATFAATRLITGALTLALILRWRGLPLNTSRTAWLSALLLFMYAAGFSFAYRGLDTGTGALVLFASAQLTMIGWGRVRGERSNPWGAALALIGLVMFLAPSAQSMHSVSMVHAALMVMAGLAWGAFSLLGKASESPVAGTASSFILSTPMAALLLWVQQQHLQPDALGLLSATVSGCLTSALGYVLWYWVRVRMSAMAAGTVQLSVPVLSALMGLAWLGERLSTGKIAAGAVVLLGVALTLRKPAPTKIT
jgi:drug/metabolite transporter (DMT)-like permease